MLIQLSLSHYYLSGKDDLLGQGSPTPGPRTSTGLWPVRNQAAQQEVSGERVTKVSFAAPNCSPSLALPPEPSTHPTLPWKNHLPQNWSLVPKSLGTAVLGDFWGSHKNIREHECLSSPIPVHFPWQDLPSVPFQPALGTF